MHSRCNSSHPDSHTHEFLCVIQPQYQSEWQRKEGYCFLAIRRFRLLEGMLSALPAHNPSLGGCYVAKPIYIGPVGQRDHEPAPHRPDDDGRLKRLSAAAANMAHNSKWDVFLPRHLEHERIEKALVEGAQSLMFFHGVSL